VILNAVVFSALRQKYVTGGQVRHTLCQMQQYDGQVFAGWPGLGKLSVNNCDYSWQ
jgi:hypothetical protein